MAERREEIVFFPFMAQGHIIPFLALALHIEQTKGCNITFVNTPLNIKRLRSSLPPTSTINLHELPFNSSDHGLPPDTENTDSLPPQLFISLFEASLSLKPSFTSLISNLLLLINNKKQQGSEEEEEVRLCIIADIFYGWTVDIAHEVGAFHAILSCSGAFGLACYHSLWSNLPFKGTESAEVTLPDFPEAGKFHLTQISSVVLAATGVDRYSVFVGTNISKWLETDAMLFNTVEEIDQIGLSYFRRKIGKPVWAIGAVLLSVANRARPGKESGISSEQCIEWLDSKPHNSVLYISFGSQNTISASQMMQLAMALELSGKNFIWVVRPPLNSDMNSEFQPEEWLPEGFLQRIEDRKTGLVVKNWAPQLEILSHKSVSAFLSQGGSNSTLQALSYGVPIIGWPLAAEQFFTVKDLEEKVGVCVEVARGNDFEVRHEDMVRKIELVMGETEKGKEMRRKCCEVKDVVMDAMKKDEDGLFKGSSVIAMDQFLNAALSG